MIIWKVVFGLIMLLALVFALFTGMVRIGVFGPIPGTDELRKLEMYTSARILDRKGSLLGLYYLQNRTHANLGEMPEHLIDALTATEDARFYRHRGIDFRGIPRVIFRSILLGDRRSGGGSTLSQQLAKNLFPRKDYGLLTLPVSKTREMIIALKLESIYSKDEILELYLNTVSFGENTYGIATASLTFFSKDPPGLRTEESALLIGLLKASSAYNPRRNPDASRERRNTVLAQMYKYGHLSQREFDSLQKLPMVLAYRRLDHVSGPAPYFREYIRMEAGKILEETAVLTGTSYNLYTDGLTIRTSLDLELQQMAERSVREHLSGLQADLDRNWDGNEPWKNDPGLASLQISQSEVYKSLKEQGLDHRQALQAMKTKRPSKVFTWSGTKDTVISPLDSILYHFGILQCGLVAIDPFTGALLAWVGGDDYGFFKYDHVTARRQAGSAFKPLVYAAALESGADPCGLYSNEPETYPEYQGWSPKNHDGRYDGYYSLQGALVHSVNTVSVKVLMETGMGHVTEMARQLGIQQELPELPSLALGAAEVPLLELAAAYSAFLNDGMAVKTFTIERISDRNGKIIYQRPSPGSQVHAMAPETAGTITAMLESVVDRGTASALRTRWGLSGPLAGKTGTTQDQSDGWFIGMTPSLVVGAWTGGDNPVVRFRSGSSGAGANSAMPVFARLMEKIDRSRDLGHYTRGGFDISGSLRASLSCEDFTERKGLKRTARPTEKLQPPTRPSPEPRKERKVRNFFKKVFGGRK